MRKSTFSQSGDAFSEVITPSGRKAARKSFVEQDGRGAVRAQKEKNGTIVKDDLVLFDKEGMHPLVASFFEDELEKQGFTPGLVLKNLGNAGVKGRLARGYAKAVGSGGVLNPNRVSRINTSLLSRPGGFGL